LELEAICNLLWVSHSERISTAAFTRTAATDWLERVDVQENNLTLVAAMDPSLRQFLIGLRIGGAAIRATAPTRRGAPSRAQTSTLQTARTVASPRGTSESSAADFRPAGGPGYQSL
jgi:hypothetical protein